MSVRRFQIALACLTFAALWVCCPSPVRSQSKPVTAVQALSFGCKADGVNDDSACLQSAADFAIKNHVGRVQLGAGTFFLKTGIKLDSDSVTLEGQGTDTSPTPHATILRCASSVDCITVGGSVEIGDVWIHDMTISNGSTQGMGSCITVDGRAATIARLHIDRVELMNCGKYGLAFEGGEGSGGYIFSIGLSGVRIDHVGGTGLYIHGRVGQLSARNIWVATATAPLVVDGGKLAEASGIDFQDLTASNSDSSHYCVQLRDASSLIFRNPHLEDCPMGLMLFQSVQNSTIDGGGYYKQSGTAFGFTFDGGASRGCDCNIVLNPQGATNTSSHKFIHNTGAVAIGDVQLGWVSRHRLTREDIEGVVPEFIGSFDHGFTPTSLIGDPVRFEDATAGKQMQGDFFDALRRDPKSNVVYVGSGSAPGKNGMVSQGPATFEKGVSVSIYMVPFSTHPIFDAAMGSAQKITLSNHAVASSLLHAASGQMLTLIVCQDAHGGWNFQWPPQFKGASQVSSVPGACTVQQFLDDGTQAFATAPAVVDR